MSCPVSRAARLLDERVGLEMRAKHGATSSYLDAPRTISKVGAHGPYAPAPVVASDDVRAMREAVLIAYESAVRELCALELPFAAHNAEVLEIIRRRNALLAAIGGAS